EHAERVMSNIARVNKKAGSATRRHVAQIIHKVIVYAVYPAKLLTVNPLPRGFLPKLGPAKAKPYLYPKEDAALMACTAIPLVRRVVYGILAREGMRAGELIGSRTKKKDIVKVTAPMSWAEVDVEIGAFRLDTNKTDDPRHWAMDPGVQR